MNALRLSFGLLTVVPAGAPRVDRKSAGWAMLLAPLTTLPVLVLAVGAHLLAQRAPVLVVAALLLGAEALITRALHLDGLADTVDGLAVPRERSLQVMKASDIGPFGVVALVLVLLLQFAALVELLPTRGGTVLAVLAWLTSRHALAWACRAGVPAAAPSGLGAMVAGSVPVVSALAGSLALLAGSGWATGWADGSWWHGPGVVLIGVLAGLCVVRSCSRRLGGVTGDVLGAVVEVALTACLVAAALVGG